MHVQGRTLENANKIDDNQFETAQSYYNYTNKRIEKQELNEM